MKIIYNKILPLGKKFYAINLFGVLFSKGPLSAVSLNHEKIHTAQIRELFYLPFYVVYIMEWAIRTVIYGNYFKAYKNISFEREAYLKESDLSYLERRRAYSFLKYFRASK